MRTLRRFAVILLAAFLFATATAAAQSPIQPDNRPTGVEGQQNARMTRDALVDIGSGCLAARDAASSLALMLRQNHADGLTLAPDDCYRPFQGQVAARSSSCSRGACPCAGTPGFSYHGWGKAVDFRDAAGGITSTANPSYQWMQANAGRYGWHHPGWGEDGQRGQLRLEPAGLGGGGRVPRAVALGVGGRRRQPEPRPHQGRRRRHLA